MSELKKLPLYETHVKSGAKFTPFAGWNMPVSYGSSLNEHLSVRNSVGLFDVSHMGEIKIFGTQAEKFLNYALTNDISKCEVGQAQYSILCSEDGGTIDDLIIYKMAEDNFLLCVNAANIQIDYETLLERSQDFDCSVQNLSTNFGQLALQGPFSERILSSFLDEDLSSLRKMHFIEGSWLGIPSILARTGYTGEDGFEIYCSTERLSEWVSAFESSVNIEVPWAGLAARDSLRLEAGFPLFGHELSEEISPLQAGLSWAVGFQKLDFIGKEALLRERQDMPRHRVIHYLVEDRRIPREGCKILEPCLNTAGVVLSGGFSPLHNKPMGSALIENKYWDNRNQAGWLANLRDNKIPIDLGLPALKRK